MIEKQGYIYLMVNKNNSVVYTGVTSDLQKRVWEHKQKFVEGFTKKYKIEKLVYYEVFEDIGSAILRENGSRKKKLELITNMNPNFEDLYNKL